MENFQLLQQDYFIIHKPDRHVERFAIRQNNTNMQIPEGFH